MSRAKPTRDYEKDDKCLCFHGAYLYEAKILDFRQEDPSDRRSAWQYRVHYKGWKNTWDDWVTEDRLRKPTEENKELAANLLKELKNQQREERDHKAAAKRATNASKRKSDGASVQGANHRASEERSSSVQAPPRGTKRGRDNDIEKEETFLAKPSIKIPLSDHLKSILVDDWENVSKNMLLVPVPHRYPVNDILESYKAAESANRFPGSADYDILEEVVQGLREYFDKALGRLLLYRFERYQYLELNNRIKRAAEIVASPNAAKNADKRDDPSLAGKTPSDLYGPEHLCRLFVTMPELIAQTNMDAQAVNRLREEIHKMTKWLTKNASHYFLKEYFEPSQDYKAQARSGATLEV